MRDRGYVLNQGDLKPGGRQGADGSLAALTGALDIDFYASESVLLGGLGSGLRCGLGGILEPRNPNDPEEHQESALPFTSVNVTMVLLKEEWI